MKGKKIYSRPMTREQSLIAAALLVGFFVIWFLWAALKWPSVACLLKSKDAASWAQAFAAVVALGIAIWVSGGSERTEKRDAVIQSRVFAKSLVIWMQSLHYGLDKNVPGMLAIALETSTELSSLAQSARYERLPPAAMEALVSLRTIMVAIKLVLKDYQKNPTQNNSSDFQKMLLFYGAQVRANSDILHKQINGVPADNFDTVKTAALFIESAERLAAEQDKSEKPAE